MAADNFDACFDHVMGSEGGFTDDRRDKGNWTGGEVGKGELKGTHWGISAAAYPRLNIRALSKADAKRIYRKDYWDRTRCDELPAGLDLCVFDAAVNSGRSRAVKWIQAPLKVTVDGLIGPATLAAAQKADTEDIVSAALDTRLDFLRDLPTWKTYGNGWAARIKSVRVTALKMASRSPVEPVPVPGVPRDEETALEALIKALQAYLELREKRSG
jgi:lysozyme family protein